jgi:hypothetical protein
MTFSQSDLLSINSILSDVLTAVDDRETKLLNKGFYVRQVRKALDELNFTTFFDVRYKDLDLPTNLKLEIPSGLWNIRNLYAFNYDDNIDCKIGQSVRVFHKDNFISDGKDMGYTANNKSFQVDPFTIPFSSDSIEHFYNTQNGLIIFSEACQNFDKVRIVYNGIASQIDEANIVPRMVQEAVIGYVVFKVFAALKARHKSSVNYRVLWADAKEDLYGKRSSYEVSVWDEAKYRLKSMDKKYRDDYAEYLSKMYY